VHALALDSRRILPVSTLQVGAYGLRDVCLSVPTVVGCGGARQQIELELSPKERTGLRHSAGVLSETIAEVQSRLVATAPAAKGAAVVAGVGPKKSEVSSIPRSAWQRTR